MIYRRVVNRISSHYLSDPYTTLVQLRRTFRFLKQLCDHNGKIFVVGGSGPQPLRLPSSWKWFLEPSLQTRNKKQVNPEIIQATTLHYDAILCLDPVLYAKPLVKLALPKVSVITPRDLHRFPEILQAFDYFLPLPATQSEEAMHKVMAEQLESQIHVAKAPVLC